MNVVFISPPETHSIESSLPEQINQGGGVYPRLGLLYVAAYFERETGLKTDFIDAPALHMDYARVEEEIRRRPWSRSTTPRPGSSSAGTTPTTTRASPSA
ncbi:MAG: hypothetical protein HYU38_10955 [Candidatus Tectomicrobia bacterium]|nr:hypothetical protein [Candidatus Tectomicrobia bacterium]